MTQTTSYELFADAVVSVRGRDRVDLLHRLSTNDLRPLAQADGVVSTLFTTNQGKLLDWTQVLGHGEQLWVVTSPGRAAAVAAWIDKYTIMEDVQSMAAPTWQAVALTGPQALALAGLGSMPALGTQQSAQGALWYASWPAWGERVEGLIPTDALPALQQAWEQAGAVRQSPADAEVARLRAGVPSHAFEFAAEVNPLELRLTQYAVGWNKGCYIGQEVISRLDSYDKVARLLVAWECDADLAGQDSLKLTQDGRGLGRATSWAPRPGGGTLGLAIVKRDGAQEGVAQIETAQGPVTVQTHLRPFFLGPKAERVRL